MAIDQKEQIRRRIAQAPQPSTTSIQDPGDVAQFTSGEKISLAGETTPQEMVTVTVPEAFTLHRDDGTIGVYAAGIQEMGVDDAAHWYSRARGVKVYDPKAKS